MHFVVILILLFFIRNIWGFLHAPMCGDYVPKRCARVSLELVYLRSQLLGCAWAETLAFRARLTATLSLLFLFPSVDALLLPLALSRIRVDRTTAPLCATQKRTMVCAVTMQVASPYLVSVYVRTTIRAEIS